MTDELLHKRMIAKRLIIVAVVLLVLSIGLFYFKVTEQPEIDAYNAQIAQEAGLQSTIKSLQDVNSQLNATIEQNGKKLVSFSEDKIVYTVRASEEAEKWGVTITKLQVSNIWVEGQMSGMTTRIEIEGNLDAVRGFVSEYCDTEHTNRITTISCRPIGRYPWMSRDIDNNLVIDWFNLDEEFKNFENMSDQQREEFLLELQAAGYNPILGDDGSISVKPLTIEEMFKDFTFKLYLEVDFLGQQ